LVRETEIEFAIAPVNPSSGCLEFSALDSMGEEETKGFAAFVFPQVNKFGLLEKVDDLADFARERGMRGYSKLRRAELLEAVERELYGEQEEDLSP